MYNILYIDYYIYINTYINKGHEECDEIDD